MLIQKKLRRHFDVDNKQDVETYRQFIINRGWGPNGCPFILEEPFVNIPVMIDNKLIRKFLKIPNVH